MKHLGDFDASAVIHGKFTTYRPSTGAAYTLAGTPALSVYKDNSTTQSTTGVTLTADFDSVTGLNHFAIDTSADGTFYSAGSFFDIVITTGTVDSVSVVGSVVASFTIRKNSALKPATAGRTLVVDASGLADANAVKVGPSGSGTAQTARDIGASVLLSAGTGTGQLDFTSGVVKANLAQILGTALTETAGQIAAAFKQFFNIATPASTMDSLTLVATATNLTNAPTNGDFTATMKTSIGTAVAASAVASVTGNVGGNVTGSIGSLATQAKADVNAEVDTAISDAALATAANLATVAGYVDTEVGAIKGVTDKLDTALESDGGVYRFTTNALEQAPTGGSAPTTAQIADKILGRSLAGGADGGRTVQDALRSLRNKTSTAGGTLTVCEEDDSTPAWTADVTTTAGDPISSIDPA